MTATFLINRTPSKIFQTKSPCELLLGENKFEVPSKVFGCTCFVRDHRPSVTKLDPKAIKCISSLATPLDSEGTDVGVSPIGAHL